MILHWTQIKSTPCMSELDRDKKRSYVELEEE